MRAYAVIIDGRDFVVHANTPQEAACDAVDRRDEARGMVYPGVEDTCVSTQALRRCYNVSVDMSYHIRSSGTVEASYVATSCRERLITDWRYTFEEAFAAWRASGAK